MNQILFQSHIIFRKAVIRSQAVPEQDRLIPILACFFEHVNVMSARLTLPEIVPSRDPVFALEFVSDPGKGLYAYPGALEVVDSDRDVQDRLRGHPRDRRAADMLDIVDEISYCFIDILFLQLEQTFPFFPKRRNGQISTLQAK